MRIKCLPLSEYRKCLDYICSHWWFSLDWVIRYFPVCIANTPWLHTRNKMEWRSFCRMTNETADILFFVTAILWVSGNFQSRLSSRMGSLCVVVVCRLPVVFAVGWLVNDNAAYTITHWNLTRKKNNNEERYTYTFSYLDIIFYVGWMTHK